ncbi:MAG: ComEC/Rec2 family competence protein [bacterium]|nr:ComEC/Rec2 family competence protein [Candidatus Colousia faecequi]
MRRRNKQYLPELYKGTTSLRLFLFLSIGVLMVNTIGIAPLWMLICGCVAFLLLVVCRILKSGDVWWRVGFVLLAVSFGGVWSVREKPLSSADGVKSFVVVATQKTSGGHLAYDARLSDALIRLNTDSSLKLNVGESVEADIRVYWPKYRGGRFNYPLYLYRKGYSGVAWLDSAKIVSRRQDSDMSVAMWRQRCVQRFISCGVSPENAGLVSAVTIGEKSYIDNTVTEDFRNAGVAHVLVVSGLHVGFLFLLINFFLRRAKRRWIVVLAGMVVMWGYAFVVGLTAPVCRATLMFNLMLLCDLAEENYNSANALSLSAVVLSVVNPLIIYDVGFQLSFLAVFSIIMFYPAIPSLGKKYWCIDKLWNAARLSLSAQMLLFPVIIYYFGQMPIYFLFANIAITLLSPIVFFAGMLTLLPFVGKLTGGILDFLLDFMRSVVAWVADLPYSTLSISLNLAEMLFLLFLILMIGNILRSPDKSLNDFSRNKFGGLEKKL